MPWGAEGANTGTVDNTGIYRRQPLLVEKHPEIR